MILQYFSGSKDWQCPECDGCFATKITVLQHMVTHYDTLPYLCDQLKPTVLHLRISVIIQYFSGSKDWQCPECYGCFATKNTMLQHMVTHYDTRSYLCDLLKPTVLQLRISVILQYFSGSKDWQCPECDTCGTTKNTILQHMVRHYDTRPYLCDDLKHALKNSGYEYDVFIFRIQGL